MFTQWVEKNTQDNPWQPDKSQLKKAIQAHQYNTDAYTTATKNLIKAIHANEPTTKENKQKNSASNSMHEHKTPLKTNKKQAFSS